jgi:trk system potassium uptake protein TrkA
VSSLEEAADVRVAFLTRLGQGALPQQDTVLQEGDLVHLVVRSADLEQVEALFAKAPEEGH